MPTSIDHIVIAVNDLERTVTDYQSLGFQVTPGGDHSHGASHNALISFQDGSYIELIAFKVGSEQINHRWRELLARGEGLIDFAVASDSLEADVARLNSAGLDARGPFPGGRHRPDGVELVWRMASIEPPPGARMPFLIDDVTPRNLRVPGGDATNHPNGASGVGAVTIAVASVGKSLPSFAALFGPATRTADHSAEFAIGHQTVRIAEPTGEVDDISATLDRHGPGPASAELTGITADGFAASVTQFGHGARLLTR